jgi:uncharacterized protein (DUF1778 family)
MSKTVTLRLNDKTYKIFKNLAEVDNRTLSNFIETSAMRHVEEHTFANEYEMADIRSNKELGRSLDRALKDMKAKRGRFVK